ncbi:RNA polymerase II-associated protein 1 [Trichinella pseudospiralis]|uniref:RNA polymerase II-associated protein 1 n=1 Tax=Trichinella pseudospiralis TaxID=6337 RepID=A0A0V0YLV6_TRIPS|nr:RNA polymerase II-associated protein 1 [Trichinella pseudospiralis]
MMQRPVADDDIVKLQEEFLKNKPKELSTKLVRPGIVNTNEKCTLASELQNQQTSSTRAIFSDVIERPVDLTDFKFQPPTIKNDIFSANKYSAHNIFEKKFDSFEKTVQAENELEKIKDEVNIENTEKLSKMTTEEILKEREKLLKSLDPQTVAFLCNKNKSSQIMNDTSVNNDKELKNDEVSNLVDSDKTQLPFDVNPSWLHMSVVEREKLEWMSDTTVTKSEDVPCARFDLQGNLMDPEKDVPTYLGLHHHADQPNKAGYTIEELVYLTRSKNFSQRVLAINVLAHIIRNAYSGMFDSIIQPPLLDAVIDTYVVLFVRLCFDEASVSMLCACLRFFESLLYCQLDETLLDCTFESCVGVIQPWLEPATAKAVSLDEDESDQALVKRDVVQGLLKMQFLERLACIFRLSYVKCSTRALGDTEGCSVGDLLCNILIRFSRHSHEICEKIVACDSIMEILFRDCLLVKWGVFDRRSSLIGHSIPVWSALKVLRLLVSADRNIAEYLIKHYDINRFLFRYLTSEPLDLGVPLEFAFKLIVESYRLWRAFVFYGLFTSEVGSLSEVLFTQTKQVCSLDSLVDFTKAHFACIRVRCIVALFETFLIYYRSKSSSEADNIVEGYFSLFAVAFQNVVNLISEHLQQDSATVHQTYIFLLNSMINFCATCAYYEIRGVYAERNAYLVSIIGKLNQLLPKLLNKSLTEWSFVLSSKSDKENSSNLLTSGFLRSVLNKRTQLYKVVNNDQCSPFMFLASFCRLLHLCKIDFKEQIIDSMLKNEVLVEYLACLDKCVEKRFEEVGHFSKFETYFLGLLSMLVEGHHHALYRIGLRLPAILDSEMEYFSFQLVNQLLQQHWKEIFNDPPTNAYNYKQVNEMKKDIVNNFDEIYSKVELLKIAQHALPEILHNFHQTHATTLAKSKALTYAVGLFFANDDYHHHHQQQQQQLELPLTSLFVKRGNSIFSGQFWMLEPLHQLQNSRQLSLSFNDELNENQLNNVFLTVMLAYSVLISTGNAVDPDNTFREPLIYQYLIAFLRDYFCHFKKINFFNPFDANQSFATFYKNLLDFYDDYSYCDPVFSNYILLPLLKSDDKAVAMTFWDSDRPTASNITLDKFMFGIEQAETLRLNCEDAQLRNLYVKAVRSKRVRKVKNSLLYTIIRTTLQSNSANEFTGVAASATTATAATATTKPQEVEKCSCGCAEGKECHCTADCKCRKGDEACQCVATDIQQ